LASYLSTSLVTHSKKAYEDLVIRLLRSPSLLRQLRDLLIGYSEKEGRGGLFDTHQLASDFLSAMFGMREVQHILSKRESQGNITFPHLLVTRGT
jgi:hypothetical protein